MSSLVPNLRYQITGVTSYCTVLKYQNGKVVQLITENLISVKNNHKRFYLNFQLKKVGYALMYGCELYTAR